jgi:hypothetical protein
MKNFTRLVLFLLILNGCFPDLKLKNSDRLYLKEIKEPNIKIDWFFYSTISSTTPDYLIVSQGIKIDTICISDNIANVEFISDVIKISFYGEPSCHYKAISIAGSVFDFEIKVDSSHVKNEPKTRKYYKK